MKKLFLFMFVLFSLLALFGEVFGVEVPEVEGVSKWEQSVDSLFEQFESGGRDFTLGDDKQVVSKTWLLDSLKSKFEEGDLDNKRAFWDKMLEKFSENLGQESAERAFSIKEVSDFLLGAKRYFSLFGYRKGLVHSVKEGENKPELNYFLNSFTDNFLAKVEERGNLGPEYKIEILKSVVKRVDYFEKKFGTFEEVKPIYAKLIGKYFDFGGSLKDLSEFLKMRAAGFLKGVFGVKVWKKSEVRDIMNEFFQEKGNLDKVIVIIKKEWQEKFSQVNSENDVQVFKKYMENYAKNLLKLFKKNLILKDLLFKVVKLEKDEYKEARVCLNVFEGSEGKEFFEGYAKSEEESVEEVKPEEEFAEELPEEEKEPPVGEEEEQPEEEVLEKKWDNELDVPDPSQESMAPVDFDEEKGGYILKEVAAGGMDYTYLDKLLNNKNIKTVAFNIEELKQALLALNTKIGPDEKVRLIALAAKGKESGELSDKIKDILSEMSFVEETSEYYLGKGSLVDSKVKTPVILENLKYKFRLIEYVVH